MKPVANPSLPQDRKLLILLGRFSLWFTLEILENRASRMLGKLLPNVLINSWIVVVLHFLSLEVSMPESEPSAIVKHHQRRSGRDAFAI